MEKKLTLSSDEILNKEFSLQYKGYVPQEVDSFLDEVDMVVVMVKHDEIKNNQAKLKGKIILDTQNIITLHDVEKL